MERHELRPIPDDNYRNILDHVPIACVDIAIYNHNNQLLMIKRGFASAVGQFWLPVGRAPDGWLRQGLYPYVERAVRESSALIIGEGRSLSRAA